MVPYWCHAAHAVRREPPQPARRRGRSRRRGCPRARGASDRAARFGRPPHAARCAVGRRRRDHARAGTRLGRAASAYGRARVRRHAASTDAPVDAPDVAPATAPSEPTTARRRASTSACPSRSRQPSSRPQRASACRSTRGWFARSPPRSRPRIAGRASRRADRRDLHRVGAMNPDLRSLRTRLRGGHHRARPSIRPSRSPSRSTSPWATCRSTPSRAARPSSTCDRATRRTTKTSRPPG